MGKRASEEEKLRAQALFAAGRSYRDISLELGGRFSPQSVNNWARKENWQRGLLPEAHVSPDNPQIFESANASPQEMSVNTDKLQESQRRRWAAHKSDLADEFGDRIRELLDRAFAPCIQKEVKVVPGPQGAGSQVQLVEVPLSLPTPADQVKLLTGVAILVDKASLLSGDATSRVETAKLNSGEVSERLKFVRDEVAERRAQQAAAPKEATG